MTLWDRLVKQLGFDISEQEERGQMHEQLQQVRASRDRAESAIDELQHQAEQTIQSYQRADRARPDLTDALRAARREVGAPAAREGP